MAAWTCRPRYGQQAFYRLCRPADPAPASLARESVSTFPPTSDEGPSQNGTTIIERADACCSRLTDRVSMDARSKRGAASAPILRGRGPGRRIFDVERSPFGKPNHVHQSARTTIEISSFRAPPMMYLLSQIGLSRCMFRHPGWIAMTVPRAELAHCTCSKHDRPLDCTRPNGTRFVGTGRRPRQL